MIESYMNQNLIWKHSVSVNEYNESTYSVMTIKGRKETGLKLVKNKLGEDVLSSSRVFTQTAVSIDDLIDDSEVINLETLIDIDGTTGFYTVYLK